MAGLLGAICCVLISAAPAPTPPATRPAGSPNLKDELPRILARDPQQALAAMRIVPGFAIELAAAEPEARSPVAAAFDERARMYLCEMIDYPFDGPEPLGSIRLLEDADGDGRYEKATTFADKLAWPTAVVPWDGGVFVGAAPDILYLKDTDGDGRADVRKVVFTGFGRQNVQGLLNSFHWGLDNRIHGATGTNGGMVRRPEQPESAAISLKGRDFSFDPRSLDLRPETGGGQHGMCFDDWGRKFICSNSDHLQMVILEDRHLARNPYMAVPSPRISIAADGPQAPVFRISPVEPWRIVRTRMRVAGQATGPIEGGGKPAGYFTSATGVTIYRGDAFPPEYRGQAFIGDVGSNVVHRKVLEPNGVELRGKRIDEGREFLASEDIWFRPAQFANAPDGTLYVIDVGREVIEHPKSVPDEIKQHLDLTNGRDRGRIWRIAPAGFKRPALASFAAMRTDQLPLALQSPNAWQRETAARLIFERQDRAALPGLEWVLENSKLPEARLHCLHSLRGLGLLTLDHLRKGLADDHPRVRENALKLVDSAVWAARLFVEQEFAAALLADEDPRVRMQFALALGELAGPVRHKTLARLLSRDREDRWLRLAVYSSVGSRAVPLIAELMWDREFRESSGGREILRALAAQVAARGNDAEIFDAQRALMAPWQVDRTLLMELRRVVLQRPPGARPEGPLAERERRRLVRSAAIVVNADVPEALRVQAIRAMALGPFAEASDLLVPLLDGRHPPEVQRAAIDALAEYGGDPRVAELLLARWPGLSPAMRTVVVDVLVSRERWALALLDAIDAGKPSIREIDAVRLKPLQSSRNNVIRERVDRMLGAAKPAGREEVLRQYAGVPQLRGDATRGKALFAQACATCHRLDGVGTEIGPSLAAMQARGPDAVLVNVLDPNREVNPQFVDYFIDTTDGLTLTGLLVAETATGVTLRRPGAADEVVPRARIARMRSSGLSIMPEGLETQLDPQAMADLIAYIMIAK